MDVNSDLDPGGKLSAPGPRAINLFWKQGCGVWKGSWRPSYKDRKNLLSARDSEQPRGLKKIALLEVLETQGTICP